MADEDTDTERFDLESAGCEPPDGEGRFWGIVPSCAFASGDPLPWLPIPSDNPCVVSKTRTGFLGLTGDLVIVFRKPYPWDGRYGGG